VHHGVNPEQGGNGVVMATWIPNDTSCGAAAPAAIVSGPRFTG
jgi:hypothetical protein